MTSLQPMNSDEAPEDSDEAPGLTTDDDPMDLDDAPGNSVDGLGSLHEAPQETSDASNEVQGGSDGGL